MATGTPLCGEIRPSDRGPPPSRQAAACMRQAPMIQAEPLETSTQMNSPALRTPTIVPGPCS
jgi:hypothetical protein